MTTSVTKRVVYALLTFSTLMLLYICRPYCPTPSTSYWSLTRWNPFPCRPCPQGAECSLFGVQRCVDENMGLKDGFVCVPQGAKGENAYELSKLAKRLLDRQAFAFNCVGKRADTKAISEEELRDSMEDNIEKVVHSEVTFTHAFEIMKEVLKNNTDAFHVFVQDSRRGADFASTRFDSSLSCLLAPHLFWENMRGTLLAALKKKNVEEVVETKAQVKPPTREATPAPEKVETTKVETTEKKEEETVSAPVTPTPEPVAETRTEEPAQEAAPEVPEQQTPPVVTETPVPEPEKVTETETKPTEPAAPAEETEQPAVKEEEPKETAPTGESA